MSNRKYFGTDGIRGRVGNAPITPDFVLKLGWAAGKVLARHGSRKIIIGKDTRISGYMLESALEAGLAAAGLSASFTGPMPTPAVAYLTRTFRAEAGIVISASHNPFYDNGIKFFSIDGTKLPDDVEEAIEAEMEKEITCVDSAELGKASRIVDAAGRYIEFCKGTFPNELSLNGLKVVVDCANGATYHIAPNVLRELGATVIAIGCEPNGVNINEEVGATDVRALQARVLAEKADLGIALDGDGDRVIMVDHEAIKSMAIRLCISSRAKAAPGATARRRGGDADEQYGAGAGAQAAWHSVCPGESGRPLRAGKIAGKRLAHRRGKLWSRYSAG